MKIHTRVVVDIATDALLVDEAHEYSGKVALAGGGGAKSKQESQQSFVIPSLLPSIGAAATNSIINPNMGNPATIGYTTSTGAQGNYSVPQSLTDINMNRAVQQIRGGYGARGLANSGIAIGGEQNAIGQLALQGQQQDQTALTNLLAAGTGSTSTGSTKQSSGLSVICTELNRQGLLDDTTYKADCEYASRLPDGAIEGYHLWGKPLARWMQRSRLLTRLLKPLAIAWATEMRHRLYADRSSTATGRLLLNYGVPACAWFGKLTRVVTTPALEATWR